MKKKILITAFMPFAGRRQNSALEVMARLRPSAFKNCRLYREKLPVSGQVIGRKISGLISKLKPDYLVSLGLAAGETAIRVERFALNIQDYGIKDNSDYQPKGRLIKKDGPAAYFVTSNPARLAAAVKKVSVPAYVSNHAGAYVCNHLMYEALHVITSTKLKTKFAFIHLPLTTEMTAPETGRTIPPSLPLATLLKAVEAIIKTLA
ncbi:MAG: pyroglutamyl-peptidase I [Elusimicrobia bacterium]|nr:pyroglutamyl-peptidase I [Elusimicrobiota bacterium]